jgi:hypothetical protein
MVTFVGEKHFEAVDFRLMGWRVVQQVVSSTVTFSVAFVSITIWVFTLSRWWWFR